MQEPECRHRAPLQLDRRLRREPWRASRTRRESAGSSGGQDGVQAICWAAAGNHERKRSSLSSAVAKKVAKGVHVGQRQEHVKRAGTRMQAREPPLQPT